MKHQVDFYKVYVEENHDPRSKYDFIIHLDFTYKRVKDLVVKGGEFVGFWNGEKWSLKMDDLIDVIDEDITTVYNQLRESNPGARIKYNLMNYESSGYMLKFQNYCKKQSPSDIQFNKKILFSDVVVKREDYSTYQLPYYPHPGETPGFDELMNTLYSPEELDKILWSLGALFTGDIAKIQKFLYLYGAKGTGKGTALDIIRLLVGEYVAPIDLQVLTGPSEFATGVLQEAPLLLDPDSDISKIQKEMNLLKLTSHEEVIVRRLHKQGYPVVFTGLLVTASNERYKVKNVDSGITRRAIVVHPTGQIVPMHRYLELKNMIPFEIPHIAQRCIDRYLELGMDYYQDDVDVDMMMWSDKVFDFVREHYVHMQKGITLKRATELYKRYLEDLDFSTTGAKQKMRSELPRFFEEFLKDTRDHEGNRVRDYFRGFKFSVAFPEEKEKPQKREENIIQLNMEEPNVFDEEAKNWPAQYATKDGIPQFKWDDVKTTLKDIDPRQLHYVRTPLNHIVIDFDIKDTNGNKDLEMNLKKASVYPKTYTETSKSGGGVHLHYYYDGDVGQLASIIEPGVEIKVFSGKSSLRRKYICSNDLPIAHISSGLPLKEKDNTMYKDVEHIVWTEKKLRKFVESCLRKEHHGATKPEIDFIHYVLTQAKENDTKYDLSDMMEDVYMFAMRSTHQKDNAMKVAATIPFKNMEDQIVDLYNESEIIPDNELYFYDIEVYPNLLLVAWKKYGFELPEDYFYTENDRVFINSSYDSGSEWYKANKNNFGIRFNPSPEVIEAMLNHPLVGFGNRKYDNHIVYNAMMGASNMELFNQSQSIIENKGGTFGNAYNMSYADLYEFLDIKMGLKKWQIKLGIKHDEFEFPWDKPLHENDWARAAQYCWNDVVSTEELFKSKYGQDAYTARKILCELTDMPVNTKTQTLAEKFLFGNDPRPQDKFNWYDLSKEFPGYKFEYGKSTYLGKDPSEGGYVSSKPGVYEHVYYIDIASLHPWSLINMNYFGPYTKKFKRLVQCRVYVKHKQFDLALHAFDDVDQALSDKLKPYLSDPTRADGLGHALKLIINIVYGMTSAPYDNKFKDPRNIDNCVAKRGALFMMTLEKELEERGVNVVHVKTDSMKLVNATQEDVDYAFQRARDYGYEFELECVFEKMALVNKSTLIGKTTDGHWEGVGAQFNKDTNPYVFKTLFSGDEVVEHDFAILKQVQTSIYVNGQFIGKNAEIYASHSGGEVTSTRNVDISKMIRVRMIKPTEKLLPKFLYEGLSQQEIIRNKYERISKELDIPVETVAEIVEAGYPETIVENHYSVTGTKGYQWNLWNNYKGKEDIDMKYYNNLVKDAVDDIFAVGDGNILFAGTKWERKDYV